MLFLREYRARSARLFDHLPWAIMVAPGVVLNKDGSFQQTLEYRGPDLASASETSLVAARGQLNNALRRLGSRWCLHFEAARAPSRSYPLAAYPDPVSHLVDEERRSVFERAAAHHESRYYLTFTYLPPEHAIGRAESLLVENLPTGRGAEALYRAALEDFAAAVAGVADIMAGLMAEVHFLDDAETLSFLHACVSTKPHRVGAPSTPAYLDALLTDDDFHGGLYPRLGDHYLRTLSIRTYPANSWPGLLDELNLLGTSYRWSCRFLPLDKEDARRAVTALRKRWFAKRKGVMALLKEAVTHELSALEDPDALVKTEDADAALMVLGGDAASLGYFTPTLTLMDTDPDRLAIKAREAEAVINRAGFVAKTEDVNAVEAWLGGLPGQAYADLRRPLVSTLNLCDMLPLSAVWPGPLENAHLSTECAKRGHRGSQPALMHASTGGSTPFRLDLHQGDVGHTMIVGPTGSGKSVLINTLALQWLRYPDAQVVMFDKGRSARAPTLLVGGRHYDLGAEHSELAFQPLADIDSPDQRAWAQDWVIDLLNAEHLTVTASLKEELWSALCNLAAGPVAQRTLTMLSATVQDQAVKAALAPYGLGGPYGSLLDAAADTLTNADWQAFEMGRLMASPRAVAPVLTYLFRNLERRFDGRPTLLILDEAWLFLESTTFARKIREWLKTLRKLNVSVVFATQSLADIEESSISAALIEGCPTSIFLPNPDAQSPRIADFYRRFGLSDRQIEILAGAAPKQDYYYRSAGGDRLFELALGPVALAVVASASPGDQALMDQLLRSEGPSGFAAGFFRAKQLPEVADYIAEAGA